MHDDLDVRKGYCLEKHVGKACIHTVSVGATTVRGLGIIIPDIIQYLLRKKKAEP